MVKAELYCDTCGQKLRGTDGTVFEPFLGFRVNGCGARAEMSVAGPESTTRHVCGGCLAGFSGLYQTSRTTGLEGGKW